jgi:hypothetical protein
MSKPLKAHLVMAKRVLRFLKGTMDYGLSFVRSDSALELIGYSDSDWGSSVDRHSISGYCFKLCESGTIISWRSQKQKVIALSTCEAEYIALASATQEAKFLKLLFAEMIGTDPKGTLYVDNQGAIALAKNPVFHKRSKHIDIKYHFVRCEVQKGLIQLVYTPSECNIADVFTKAFPKSQNCKLLNLKC